MGALGVRIMKKHRKSGKDLTVPSLSRNIELVDLYAINSYQEISAMEDGPYLKQGSPACTQFLAMRSFTYDNYFWAGRNMDGENDKWRVTVTHLIIFAIEATSTTPRIISIMWPGHASLLSLSFSFPSSLSGAHQASAPFFSFSV